jgi:glycosyltransferase involved in cell wall biosynthesis
VLEPTLNRFHGVQILPITLIIPAYKAETNIRAALESVRIQSRLPAEIIVVDDASPDRTGDVAKHCGATVIRLPRNVGPAAARNVGAAAAQQPWLAFLDSDDVWLGGKLAAQWEALQRWPDAGICFTDYDVVNAAGRVHSQEMAGDSEYARTKPSARYGHAVRFEREALARGLVRSMFIRQSSVIVQRELFRRNGGYDEGLRLGEDFDFFLRVIAKTPIAVVERPLVAYHRSDGSLSGDPVAEIASINRLWETILEWPERYPAVVVAMIEEQRPATLRTGCRIALRLGRFAEAIPFAERAFRCDRAPAGFVLLCLAKLIDNTTGRATFHVARSLWRMRYLNERWRRTRPPGASGKLHGTK